jgi:predicted transcriptional regulator
MKNLHPVAAKLLADIERFRARVGIDRTAFGVKAAGDGHFITRVEEGKIPRITTIDRVYAYMDGKTKAVRTRSITTIERQR